MMVNRRELESFCAELLEIDRFRDAAVNGLQVEGAEVIRALTVAVSANQRTIKAAAASRSHGLLVHHGLLWGEGLGPIRGLVYRRLRALIVNELNLFAYHLPLDAHPEIGNNAQLARALDLRVTRPFAEIAGVPIGVIAEPPARLDLRGFTERVGRLTGRPPTVLGGGPDTVSRVAVVSGSGYAALDEAAALGCDVLLTGDAREPTMALARELGVTVVAAGHEATERLGVQELARVLSERFDLETQFIDDPNPV